MMMKGLPRHFLVKKIKFTHISNTRNSIRENFIQYIKSEKSSSQYFTLNDLTALNYDQNNDFSVFHLSINFLQYHFYKLQTFLSNCLIDNHKYTNSRIQHWEHANQVCNGQCSLETL